MGVGGSNRGTPEVTNGIATSASVGVTTAASDAITADEFLEFLDSLDEAYESGGRQRLMTRKRVVSALGRIKDGQQRYLFDQERAVPTMDAQYGATMATGTINHVPYILNGEMDAVAAGKTVAVYGDLKQYRLLISREIRIERFHDSKTAGQGEVWFAGYARGAGVLPDTNAIKKLVMHA